MAIGEFYFAYADAGETFDPDVHNVKDEDIFSFNFTHEEGDFAQIDFDIKNPRIGLLNIARQRWAFFSKHTPTGIEPMFYGRVIGIPNNVFAEVVTVTYTARPEDYIEQKSDLADTLKVAPFWDPIFIAANKIDDPDAVLESRPALWYINPVTHVVSISNVIAGEDGTIEKQANDYFADSLDLTLNQSPATKCIVRGSVNWAQHAVGANLDLMPHILQLFPGRLVETFTMQGLKGAWPKTGSTVPGGYVVQAGELEDVSFLAVPQLPIPDHFRNEELPVALPIGSIAFEPRITGHWTSGPEANFDITAEVVYAAKGYGKGTLLFGYDVTRDFTENLTVILQTSTQPIVTDPGEDEIIEIEINGNKVSDFIRTTVGAGFEVPLGPLTRRTFFNQTRGKQAIKYLVCCARAALTIKSRAVEISFEVPIDDGLEYTLRKNSLIHNPRLPGGQALGKVIRINHSLDGDTGAALTKITMACAIGKGEAPYSTAAGSPVYCSTSYVGADYQQFTNVIELIDPSAADLAFTVTPYIPDDDGIDFTNLTAREIVRSVGVQNPAFAQNAEIAPLARSIGDTQQVSSILQEFFTQVDFEFVNLEVGPFETEVTITVEDLVLPSQINLEAPSAP